MLIRAGLAAAFFLVALWRQDPALFGYYHDDTLYFASAKALASGEGYAIPSLPGSPAQTKYPILYPLLLSAVWKISPRFPDNVPLALGLTALFGAALAAGWSALLEQLGASRRESLLLAAVSALHPFILSLSGAALSDVPFMALAVWTAVFAERRRWALASAGACAGLLTRSLGLAVVAGVVAAAVRLRNCRGTLLCAGPAALALAAGAWWSAARGSAPAGLPGYRQNLQFYTSYAGFWRRSVPDLPTLASVVGTNALEILQAPASLCLPLPHLPGGRYAQSGVLIALSAAILAGMARLPRHPIREVLAAYAGMTLLWNYPLANRFLVLFLPVFWLGALRIARALPRRRVLAPVAALLLFESAYANFRALPEQLSALAADRRAMAQAKGEAYEWITRRTAPEDRFIAYEDVALYLYTGRQAMRPLTMTSPPRPDRDLPGLADTARQIGARYWLVSADDYQLEEAAGLLVKETQRLLRTSPVVFQSRDGRVQIRQVGF